MIRCLARLGALLLMLVLIASCGPGRYIYTVTAKASRLYAQAKTAGAEKLAPYEFWSAQVYLRMAREKAGDADWQIALRYGEQSAKMSQEATRLARERAEAGPGTIPSQPTPEDDGDAPSTDEDDHGGSR
ncbi:MAG: DUF4398 domain-containing protein [Deltaproteobacteria bacterium]|nr:DUF4398 domain-containing protein [Deltaproteobacteria bacterium]